MAFWAEVAADIEARVGRPFRPSAMPSEDGGLESRSVVLESGGLRCFVKRAALQRLPMFEAEAAGLALLAATRAVRVPEVISVGGLAGGSYIALEYVAFASGGAAGERRLGAGLAAIHANLGPHFGWERDNTIGTTPQFNAPDDDWARFFACRRLRPQLDLAEHSGYGGAWLEDGRRLAEALDCFFEDYAPVPSLVHGDLWGGNAAFDRQGRPVLFDPAVYYGDRETDLAMTELFGGFQPAFYSGYEAAWPVDSGYDARRGLYQLYHVLNHLNLFGGAYLASSQRLIRRLLALTGS